MSIPPKILSFFSMLMACIGLMIFVTPKGQAQEYWHDIPRELRYHPDEQDFVINNGDRRFNRALYGYHSDFRTEAGDQPLFSFYLPGMGGHFRLGIQRGEDSKWLHECAQVEARYRAGMMVYHISDPLFEGGSISLEVMPLRDREGAIFKLNPQGLPQDLDLTWLYGGVTGKKFRRMGDLGADPPTVFDLSGQKAEGNEFVLNEDNQIELQYGADKKEGDRSKMMAVFPPSAKVKIGSAEEITSPKTLWGSQATSQPVVMGRMAVAEQIHYFAIFPENSAVIAYDQMAVAYDQANIMREEIANRVQVRTPDPYINTVAGALCIAADAIYDAPAYVHGAVAWRMPLPGWRGAYVANDLGWHDRAKVHFDGYLASQYLAPGGSRNDPDSTRHLARQMEQTGKSIFNEGYISRRPGAPSAPHHYDMNQVFFDQLIRYFDWTGDIEYLREVWPNIERHLNWEKRNFDPDGDGLYNAYASIWASDALQYNSGGVAHASAYNYYANKRASELAEFIGADGSQYQQESAHILKAMNDHLWLSGGWYAEYKDFLGPKNLHPQAGLWSIYHSIDSEVPDPFQAWQMTRYVDTQIPHIPLVADGLEEGQFHSLSTTNWMPYTWSVNNVALAEVLHTSLAYWQAGNTREAYRLWKSALLESMYLGGSPGNFQQLSFIDAMRGELYRDFADAVGMGARSLIEGLFGLMPDLMNDRLVIKPGFPSDWPSASLSTPNVAIHFERNGEVDHYEITNRYGKPLTLELIIRAQTDRIAAIKIDGESVDWKLVENHVGTAAIMILSPLAEKCRISITWQGKPIKPFPFPKQLTAGEYSHIDGGDAQFLQLNDPEGLFAEKEITTNGLNTRVGNQLGDKTFFAKLQQGQLTWWEPIALKVVPKLVIKPYEDQSPAALKFSITNYQKEVQKATLMVNGKVWKEQVNLSPNTRHDYTVEALSFLQTGTNVLELYHNDILLAQQELIHWDLNASSKQLEMQDITAQMNDKVSALFRNEYLSPRSPYPTLQLPIQGMGDWASYAAYMDINDEGLRKLAGKNDQIVLPQGIPFKTPAEASKDNILFASLWDNYPESVQLPLAGKAAHAYLLMAGSTNHMQSRIENGQVVVHYKDGSRDSLSLRNPESWWPIEQDYYIDDYAYKMGVPRPFRVHLKTGKISRKAHDNYVAIDHFTEYGIDGGAATVLDLPLDPKKELDYLEVKATTIEVVIGLMAVTLERE
ncbi:DUF4450 domain-containing protein [Echinicola pacifica]|nr:DUF4450 domain-containing protein [Echinicola pacifica]